MLVTAADLSACRNQVVLDLPIPSKTTVYITDVKWEPMKTAWANGLSVEVRGKEPFSGVLRIDLSDGRSVAVPVLESGLDASHVVTPAGGTVSKLSPCVL